jgi:hypothetical protein
MKFSYFIFAAVLLAGLSAVVSAQSAARPIGTSGISAEIPVAVSGIDVSRLPIDVRRIEQRFRQGQIREERDGLNLRYFVDVFAKAPNIVLFTKEDNLQYGQVPHSAPTHRDMLEMMTPRPFRNHGGVNILDPNPSKKK